MKDVLCFKLCGRDFGVDVAFMAALENDREVMPRDDLPDFVAGVVDLHGDLVPLINVEGLFELGEMENKENPMLVFFYVNNRRFAIRADSVSEIIHAEGIDVQAFPTFIHGGETRYVDCIVRRGTTLILVLFPQGLLTKEQWGELKKLTNQIDKEKREAEEKRLAEIRKKREEERKKREEERAAREAELAKAQEN